MVAVSLKKKKEILNKYGIIPADLTDDQKNRIKYINDLRNKIIHAGKSIPYKKSDDLIVQVATPLTLSVYILPALIEHYLNIKFGIEGYFWPSNTFQSLNDFFINGNLLGVQKGS